MISLYLIIVGAVLLISIIVTATILFNKYLGKEEYKDYTLIENLWSQVTNGFSEGDLVGFIPGSCRNGYIFRPTDVDYLRRSKEDKTLKIENQIVWAYSYQIEELPATTLSGERNKIKIYPPTPEDLPYKVQQTAIGKALMEVIANRKATKTAVEVIRSERNVEDIMLKDTVGKDLFRERLKESDIIWSDTVKKAMDESKTKPGYVGYNNDSNYPSR